MDLVVSSAPNGWRARSGALSWRCALGRGGVVAAAEKREGDGATPAGRWPLRRLLYRPDRESPRPWPLPAAAIAPDQGWCDDPSHPAYNRQVRLPFPASHERLWRDDGLYDLVVVLGHNDDPPRAGAGSAIFLHCAGPGWEPTEGCVALCPDDLRRFLLQAGPEDGVRVELPAQTDRRRNEASQG